MRRYSLVRLFGRYLHDRARSILYLAAVVVTFGVVLSLYGLDLEPLLYASVLSAAIGFVLTVADYVRYVRRYATLDDLRSEVLYSLERLPECDTLIEQTYTELLESVHRDSLDYRNATERTRLETLDYYTTWVHQIKTPIFAMRLLLQTDGAQDTRALQNELFKVEQYVDMVLSYLRIGSDSTDFVVRSYSLYGIVEGAIKKYARPLILKRVSVRLDPIGSYVLTDEKWLSFVVEQVLSNAVKYTHTGGSVHVYAVGSRLCIQDDGVGIAPEDLPRVFEKGFTGCNGRLESSSTGIGLYLCKKVLDRLNHRIEVRSELDVGTTVSIDFSTHVDVRD